MARDEQVEGLSGVTVVAVACGAFHSLAVTSSGRLYEWGLIHTEPDVVAGQVRTACISARLIKVDGIHFTHDKLTPCAEESVLEVLHVVL